MYIDVSWGFVLLIVFFVILISIQYSLNAIWRTMREVKVLLEMLVNREK